MRLLRLAFSRSGLRRSFGVIESMIAICRLSTRSSRPAFAIWFFILAMPGIMPIRPPMPPICCICASCSRRSPRSNAPLRIFSAARSGLLGIDVGGGLLDQRDDVAHAEDAAGNARGIEIFQRVELFAGADQFDRLAGDGAHRERGAAAAIAVDAREHDAGQADAFVERAREVDRVLAGQRIGDEQHFVRIGGAVSPPRLPPSSLRRAWYGPRYRASPRRNRRGGRLRARGVRFAAASGPATIGSVSTLRLAAEHGELLHRSRTAHVERGHQHFALAACSVRRFAILAVVVVLPEPCRPTIMMATGGAALRSIGLASEPSVVDELVVHDLHDHLAGRDRLDHLDADGVLLHLLDERARDIERDVGLEQRAAHLAQRHVDIGFRQRAAPRQAGRECRPGVPKVNRTSISSHLAETGKTQKRPRAHCAVGRLPPASQGRSAELVVLHGFRDRAETRDVGRGRSR